MIGCSSASKKDNAPEETDKQAKTDPSEKVHQLTTRLAEIESKLEGLSDKVESNRSSLDNLKLLKGSSKEIPPANLTKAPGPKPKIKEAPDDPMAGFEKGESISIYRDGLILKQADKFSEAILKFSQFTKEFADHPLAGSAQFHIGDCYLSLGENKLALREFERVLISYDRSSHVSETLQKLIQVENALNRTEEAEKRKQQLLSLFPQSPAAAMPQQTSEETQSKKTTVAVAPLVEDQ